MKNLLASSNANFNFIESNFCHRKPYVPRVYRSLMIGKHVVGWVQALNKKANLNPTVKKFKLNSKFRKDEKLLLALTTCNFVITGLLLLI